MNAPVVLHIAGGVAVVNDGNRHWNNRCAAFQSNRNRDVEVVDLPVAIEVRETEVGGKDDRARTKDVDLAIGNVMLKLAIELQRVLAEGP